MLKFTKLILLPFRENSAMKRKKLALILSVFVLFVSISSFAPEKAVALSNETDFEAMKERAEAIVNFEWTPSERIDVWNENPYNGKMYFEAGETVKGMPYTLFTSEIVSDSLLSLDQFKEKVHENYSSTAYCYSVGATRTGPVYGSCCATFVSEVFGGSFMNGSNPKYDSVQGIQNSVYSTTTRNVKAEDIVPGDALSSSSGSHIVWVGDVSDSEITIYEQTPPIARKVIVDLETSINESGYLIYGDGIYNVVTKSNDNLPPPYEVDQKFEKFSGFKAYPCVSANFKTKSVDLVTNDGEIYVGDYCTIHEVYSNGWCKVSFPITATGGTKTAYTEITNFIENPSSVMSLFTAKDYMPLFPTSAMDSRIYRIYPGDNCYYFGKPGKNTQLFMPHNDGYYVLGWADLSFLKVPGDINGDGTVNNKDLTRLLKYLAGEDVEVVKDASDTNNDGAVNNKDLTRLLKYIAGENVEMF